MLAASFPACSDCVLGERCKNGLVYCRDHSSYRDSLCGDSIIIKSLGEVDHHDVVPMMPRVWTKHLLRTFCVSKTTDYVLFAIYLHPRKPSGKLGAEISSPFRAWSTDKPFCAFVAMLFCDCISRSDFSFISNFDKDILYDLSYTLCIVPTSLLEIFEGREGGGGYHTTNCHPS